MYILAVYNKEMFHSQTYNFISLCILVYKENVLDCEIVK